DTFIDGADILLAGGEIRAVPFLVDPLMLYWNRDLLRNESLSEPPKTWDEFLTHAAKLTKIDQAGNILASGAALGLETNVQNFKEILSMLILQAGNPIVEPANFRVVISRESPFSKTPAENALRFYTEFARPSRSSYSWSGAEPDSREAFSRGILAFYFGFASEFPRLRSQNPHLNFDLTAPPQIRGGKLNLTYGRIYSLGVPQNSKYPQAAVQTIFYLLESDVLGSFAEKVALAPSKRALLSTPSKNPVTESVWREAVRVKSWPEIDPAKTSEIFGSMIRSVYSGAKNAANAVRDAELQLQAIYPN
ncbi:MAG: extracellular solute-binding protein, partial [Patescibacteria group bacterium]